MDNFERIERIITPELAPPVAVVFEENTLIVGDIKTLNVGPNVTMRILIQLTMQSPDAFIPLSTFKENDIRSGNNIVGAARKLNQFVASKTGYPLWQHSADRTSLNKGQRFLGIGFYTKYDAVVSVFNTADSRSTERQNSSSGVSSTTPVVMDEKHVEESAEYIPMREYGQDLFNLIQGLHEGSNIEDSIAAFLQKHNIIPDPVDIASFTKLIQRSGLAKKAFSSETSSKGTVTLVRSSQPMTSS